MTKIIHLFNDMTFDEIDKKADENKFIIGKKNVSFKEGQSIFRERHVSMWKIWKKRRNLGIYIDGSLNLHALNAEGFHSEFGTLDQIRKYIASEIAKTKSRQKSMETWQFIVIMILLAVIVVMQLKGLGIIQ